MVYDFVRERVVLLGGFDNATRYGDVWEWDGTDWTEMATNNGLVADGNPCCYDPLLGGVFLRADTANILWNGASWRFVPVQQGTPGCSVRLLAYSSRFGGSIGVCGDGTTELFRAPAGWSPLLPRLPDGYNSRLLASDPIAGSAVLLGRDNSRRDRLATWITSGIGWSPVVRAVPSRDGAAFVFDSRRHAYVLFGGRSDASPNEDLDDTWTLRVFDETATYETYGAGCGSPDPGLDTDPLLGARPLIGGVLGIRGTDLPPTSPCVQALGFSDTLWNGLTLPFDLGPLGAPGCTILAAPEILDAAGSSDATGDLRLQLPIANDFGLVGLEFFHQLIALAPGANAAGIVVSNGGAGVIGVR